MSVDQEVLDVATDLVSAFGHHDTDTYFSHFGADATFIFYNHPHTLTSRQHYRDLWEQWEAEGFHVLSCESTHQAVQMVTPDCAVFTHHVNTRARVDGEIIDSEERETIVFAQVLGRWIAVHEHLSAREQEAS